MRSVILKKSIVLSFLTLFACFLSSNTVQSIPPEEAFPNGIENLQDSGGGWIPLNKEENSTRANLDEGSYWYQIYQDQEQGYLVFQKLLGRKPNGKAIFEHLDVAVIPELALKNNYQFGLIGSNVNYCQYPNGESLEDSRVILVVKYHQDTATPIKSFLADTSLDKEKWVKPSASLIKNLTCELPQP